MNPGCLGNPSYAARELASQVYIDLPSNPLPGAGLHVSVTHGMPTTPHHVEWVLECFTAENGYLPGDQVDVHSIYPGGAPLTTWRDGTKVGLSVDVNRTLTVASKTASTSFVPTAASWKFKVYVKAWYS